MDKVEKKIINYILAGLLIAVLTYFIGRLLHGSDFNIINIIDNFIK